MKISRSLILISTLVGFCSLLTVGSGALLAAHAQEQARAPAQYQDQALLPRHPRHAWAAALYDEEADATFQVSAETDAPYISGAVKRPFIYFRQLANRRWRPGILFFFLFNLSAALKLLLPRLNEAVAARARGHLFSCLASAFFYATILMGMTRLSFHNPDLSAMGIFCFGLVQFSFCMGGGLGVNIVSDVLYRKRPAPQSTTGKVMLYGVCLLAVASVVALISLVPNIGPLPRLGNRMVALIAAFGLGALVNLAVNGSAKSEPG